MRLRFPLILQSDSSDCGVASLAMIARFYGVNVDYDALRQECQVSRIGISMYTINAEAQKLGFTRIMIPAEQKIDPKRFTIQVVPVKKVTDAFRMLIKG